MSALSIQPTYPIFTDIDGQPLEAGYVWIGTANLDPQTNPITVYWDAALTILAPQPIRTLAGYPSNNGTPARLYVDSDYSIRVMNKNGSVLYSAPTKTEAFGDISSAVISFIQSGIGAVTRTAQSKMREVFSVLDFGADTAGAATANAAAIQAAIDACPVGGTVVGLGLTFPCTGVEVNKAITVEGIILDMVELIPSQTSQDAFTITESDVKLINCGAIISQFTMPNTTNSAGVYSYDNNNVVVDGGEWIGSINKNYTPGNFRGCIFIEGGFDCVVKNTITRDAFGEGLWIRNSDRAYITNNKAYNAGGSEIVFQSNYGLMIGNTLVGNPVAGNSGAAVAGDYVTIAYNEIIDASGWGITHGEVTALGGLIVGNTIKGHAKFGTGSTVSGINSQKANGLVISGNIILAPSSAGSNAYGILVGNAPVSAIVENNYIENTTAQGIFLLDSGGTADSIVVRNNTVKNTPIWGIFVSNFKTVNIEGNTIENPNSGSLQPGAVYIQHPDVTPDYIRVVGNTVKSDNANSSAAVFLNSVYSSSTQYIQHDNVFLNWVTQPYTDGRSCNYDVRNDNYAISPKSGLVTLTNGGTTTVVTTAHVSSKSVVLLEIGNAAAATLNPVYRISTLVNGSFTITHTAGTAAGEQLKWTII